MILSIDLNLDRIIIDMEIERDNYFDIYFDSSKQ